MHEVREWMGVEIDEVSFKEKLVSALGGLVAILLIIEVSERALGLRDASMLIASMGASSVLLFAVPRGQLSQPWPVVGGHVISAATGVTCAMLIPQRELAAACAVGIAIGLMHQCRCIHPPGGATALTAVIGGPAVAELGFAFVIEPVLLNAMIITLVAVGFNWFFPWRRYPQELRRRTVPLPELSSGTDSTLPPTHEEVLAAMSSIDSFIDISERDLIRLHRALLETRSAQNETSV